MLVSGSLTDVAWLHLPHPFTTICFVIAYSFYTDWHLLTRTSPGMACVWCLWLLVCSLLGPGQCWSIWNRASNQLWRMERSEPQHFTIPKILQIWIFIREKIPHCISFESLPPFHKTYLLCFARCTFPSAWRTLKPSQSSRTAYALVIGERCIWPHHNLVCQHTINFYMHLFSSPKLLKKSIMTCQGWSIFCLIISFLTLGVFHPPQMPLICT